MALEVGTIRVTIQMRGQKIVYEVSAIKYCARTFEDLRRAIRTFLGPAAKEVT